MSLKLGYKQTEIGVIPDDWAPVKFGSICHRRRESGVPTAESFVIELEHIESGSGRLVGESSVQTMSSKRVFQEGDVLFGRLRSYLRKYLLAERDGFCSTEIWALVPENERVESGFLFQVVRLDGFITATGISYGTHMPRSDWSTIKEWPLFLPPPKEQKAIAEALSDVDALIDSLEALLTKKRNIKTGVMQELLTGRTRLPGFSDEWRKTTLDELVNSGVVKLGRGNVISKKDMEADPGLYPVYSSAQNNGGCIGAYNKYMFNEELITWSVDGGGYVFYRPSHKFSVTNICGYLRVLDESKFQYLFLTAVLQELHSQHTFDWLNKAHPRVIRNLYRDIPLVPITEQKAIAAVLSDMDDEIEALEKRLAKTRDLKQGMSQELLSGRTRLV
jgi:type I restriction enzyme S subunit